MPQQPPRNSSRRADRSGAQGRANSGTTKAAKAKAAARAKMYRRRRITVSVLVLVVLVAVMVGVAQGVAFIKSKISPSSPTSAQQVSEEPTGPTEEELSNPTTCASDAVDLELDLPVSAVAAGSGFAVSTTITNVGEVPCLLDIGSEAMSVMITSGDDSIFSTDVCPSGAKSNKVLLAPGATEDQHVTWNGRRSTKGCGSGGDIAKAGSYKVAVNLATADVAATADQRVEITKG